MRGFSFSTSLLGRLRFDFPFPTLRPPFGFSPHFSRSLWAHSYMPPLLPLSFPGPHPSSAAGLPASHPTTAISRKGECGRRGFSKQTQGFGVRGGQAGGETDRLPECPRQEEGEGPRGSSHVFQPCPGELLFLSTLALPSPSHFRGAPGSGERDSKPCFPGHPTQGLVGPPEGTTR